MRPRSDRRPDERGWALALQLMPAVVLVGSILAAAALPDDPRPILSPEQSAERTTGSSGHLSTGGTSGGGWDAPSAPSSATTPGGPSRTASDGSELAVPAEPPRAPDVRPWFSGRVFDVVIPEGGVRLPSFDLSLPTGEVLVGWDRDPSRASALTPAVVSEHGPGPVPVVLLLVGLACLAFATGRRIDAMRRRAGPTAPGAGPEADDEPRPAETEVDGSSPAETELDGSSPAETEVGGSSPADTEVDGVPPSAETEAVEVPARLDAAQQPTSRHAWDQPRSPAADLGPDLGEGSPAPSSDQSGRRSTAGSAEDMWPATAAPPGETEPLDTLTERPAGTVIGSRSAPDDPRESPPLGPVTGPTPLVEVTIIRAPKRARIRW